MSPPPDGVTAQSRWPERPSALTVSITHLYPTPPPQTPIHHNHPPMPPTQPPTTITNHHTHHHHYTHHSPTTNHHRRHKSRWKCLHVRNSSCNWRLCPCSMSYIIYTETCPSTLWNVITTSGDGLLVTYKDAGVQFIMLCLKPPVTIQHLVWWLSV